MKCRFCKAESVAIFEMISFDGHTWEAPLCIECTLLIQAQGYSTHVKKKVEENERTKGKEEKENEEIRGS
jgi:hypothetical protein